MSSYSNYSDPRTETILLEWGLFEYNYTLLNGRTILEDMAKRPVDGLTTAQQLLSTRAVPTIITVTASRGGSDRLLCVRGYR